MKLRNRNESPVGGFAFNDPAFGPITTTGTFDKLIRAIEDRYAGAGVEPPEGLREIVEDQICTRQPPGKCFYTKGLGDGISRVIHAAAGIVDKFAGTKLQTKARGCSSCARRREKLNRLTS